MRTKKKRQLLTSINFSKASWGEAKSLCSEKLMLGVPCVESRKGT